jgi:2-phosphoglycerate kinase
MKSYLEKAMKVYEKSSKKDNFYRRLSSEKDIFLIVIGGLPYIGNSAFSEGVYIENFETATKTFKKMYVIPIVSAQ